MRVEVPSTGEKYCPEVLLELLPFLYKFLSLGPEIVRLYPALQLVTTLMSSVLITALVLLVVEGVMSVVILEAVVIEAEYPKAEGELSSSENMKTTKRERESWKN